VPYFPTSQNLPFFLVDAVRLFRFLAMSRLAIKPTVEPLSFLPQSVRRFLSSACPTLTPTHSFCSWPKPTFPSGPSTSFFLSLERGFFLFVTSFFALAHRTFLLARVCHLSSSPPLSPWSWPGYPAMTKNNSPFFLSWTRPQRFLVLLRADFLDVFSLPYPTRRSCSVDFVNWSVPLFDSRTPKTRHS